MVIIVLHKIAKVVITFSKFTLFIKRISLIYYGKVSGWRAFIELLRVDKVYLLGESDTIIDHGYLGKKLASSGLVKD